MYRELCYYSWILWFFSLSISLWWIDFPFEVILPDWVFKDLRTLDVCLAWDTRGGNGVFYWFTWRMFWWSTYGFRDLGNLCIGVGTHFRLDSTIETLGHSLKYFCVGWIDESKIVWCISYNHTHGYLRWLIRLQRIYNFWLLHAILSTVLDFIGLYFTLLYYFLGLTY